MKGAQTALWWLSFELKMPFIGYLRTVLFITIIFLAVFILIVKPKKAFNTNLAFPKNIVFLLACLVSYLVILFLSLLFLDPAILLDYRILSPAYVIMVVLSPVIFLNVSFNRIIKYLIVALATCNLIYLAEWGTEKTSTIQWNAYQRFNWRKLQGLDIISNLPAEAKYYTNDPELFYTMTSRVPSMLNREQLSIFMDPDRKTSSRLNYLVFFKHKVPKSFLPDYCDLKAIVLSEVIFESSQIYLSRID